MFLYFSNLFFYCMPVLLLGSFQSATTFAVIMGFLLMIMALFSDYLILFFLLPKRGRFKIKEAYLQSLCRYHGISNFRMFLLDRDKPVLLKSLGGKMRVCFSRKSLDNVVDEFEYIDSSIKKILKIEHPFLSQGIFVYFLCLLLPFMFLGKLEKNFGSFFTVFKLTYGWLVFPIQMLIYHLYVIKEEALNDQESFEVFDLFFIGDHGFGVQNYRTQQA